MDVQRRRRHGGQAEGAHHKGERDRPGSARDRHRPSYRRRGVILKSGMASSAVRPGQLDARRAACASCSGMNCPVPSHQGHVCVDGDPPRFEIT
jgi:hypothetical protein